MDNRAFYASRGSSLSDNGASPRSLRKNTHIKVYDNSHIFQTQSSRVTENEIENLETQSERAKSEIHCDDSTGKCSAYSEVPLVDALHNKMMQKSLADAERVSESQRPPSAMRSNKNSTLRTSQNSHSTSASARSTRSDSSGRGNMIGLSCPADDSLQVKRRLQQTSASSQAISRSVQVWPAPAYRLRVLPRASTYVDEDRVSLLAYIGRCLFCQLGLSTFLLIWIVAGAASFYFTEGPAEVQVEKEQKNLVRNLVQELKNSPEALWQRTIERYMYRQDAACSDGNADMTTGAPGKVWTLPGSILFAISLITTLGFGAPVPRTPEGRAVTVIFAAVGIPLHLILVLNIGMVIAVKLQKLATRNIKQKETPEENEEITISDPFKDLKRNSRCTSRHRRSGSEPIGRQAITNITREANFIIGESREHKYQHIAEGDTALDDKEVKTSVNNFLPVKNHESTYNICRLRSLRNLARDDRKHNKDIGTQPHTMPLWLKWLPFVSIAVYYGLGVLIFGFGREQNVLDSLLFPLDFTVAGGVAHTEGHIRVLYGIYLEVAVVIAASTVSILQVTATKGFTDLGLRHGLLTNSR